MGMGPRQYEQSAASHLARIINRYAGQPVMTQADVRLMIEKEWTRVSSFAHTIHEEVIACKNALEVREKNELARLKAKYES